MIKKIIGIVVVGFITNTVSGQFSKNQLAGQMNVITTSVPFLTITPDSRSAALGDAGVALSPDANSIHWNCSKLAFAEKKSGISISYAPWLRKLVPDVSFSYLSGYSKIGKRSAIGGSFRFFSLGNINFTDFQGDPQGQFNPNEFALDGSYSSQLSKKLAVGVALRFVRSNLAGTRNANGVSTKPGTAGAGDISVYYKDKMKQSGKDIEYAFGLNLQNMGSKISYTDKTQKDFIPMNLKMGTAWTVILDEFSKITFTGDLNKLMVPTPQYSYLQGKNGGDSLINGEPVIVGKKQDNTPVVQGLFQSFGDAPGGFKEELKEFNYSLGTEYWYMNQFAVRGGLFHETKTKGNRKYATLGIGLKYSVFSLDVAYLIPIVQRHPLENQMRFTLNFDMAAFSDKDEKVK